MCVGLRQRAVDCSQVNDVLNVLESLESYQCRAQVKQVVRLVRVMVCSTPSTMLLVEVSTSGCSVPLSVIQSGLSGVQSFVMQPKLVSTELLTVDCIEELKGNLLNGLQFLGFSTFDPWGSVSRHPYDDVFGSIFRCYTAYRSGQVDEWSSRIAVGPSSRCGASGTASIADTDSVGEMSVSRRSTTSSASQKKKGSRNSLRQQKSY